MRSALVVALLFLACSSPPPPSLTIPHGGTAVWEGSPETPAQAALRIWIRVHGKVATQCADAANNIRFRVLSENDVKEACRNPAARAACMDHYDVETGGTVVLNRDASNGLSYSVRVHEILHVLLWCAGIGSNEGNLHQDLVWAYVPQNELPPESPWHIRPPPAPVKRLSP